ncbi:centrosomal protein of 135 kDa isoform X2 [Drosophila tropicalis]|uniref:centrosomal protein of 135 kDa isoform X2 n=1 Tax=Drosophila tropicalis TaxID=46794 RepID=UPI0035ABC58A
MNINDGDFKELRAKLDVMGFNQTLPVLAIPLVQAIFGDLIKTTECLRDTKKQVASLLEEKTCWELGIEPYKCDNSRLLAECNQLHLQFIKEREDYELRICEAERRIRNLQTDREHLQCHNVEMQNQLDAMLSKQMVTSVGVKRNQGPAPRQGKKPFISTVRSGNVLPTVLGSTPRESLKCTKCNAGIFQKTTTTSKDGGITVTQTSGQEEIDKLQNDLTAAGEQLEFYKRKVESRNREIRRLNDMLSGGRPPAALAKDCCYKDVGALSQDIDLLQREKTELMIQVQECRDKMHDAMKRAVSTEEEKLRLQKQMEELKETALQVERQANSEIEAKELQLRQLQLELKQSASGERLAGGATLQNDKRNLNERFNLLTRREEELDALNDKQKKKLHKMHAKITALQKELRDQNQHVILNIDEEKIRLKSERDFFQKEYLRLMSKSGSDTELAFLHAQIKSKDEELKALRAEIFSGKLQISPQKSQQYETIPPIATQSLTGRSSSNGNSSRSDCVQATIGRIERERDCVRSELERVRCERDTLREKQLCSVQLHAEELQSLRQRNEELQDRLRRLERDNRDLNSARVPTETNIVLLREDIAELKQRVVSLQNELQQAKTENAQISLINEQNERLIADYHSKLIIAERQRQTADVRASSLDSSRETNLNELTQLRSELGALRKTFISLEHEKDTLLIQLDAKTERSYKLEYDLKDCRDKKLTLEKKLQELEEKLLKVTTRSRQRDSELNETCTESKTLRQQLMAIKTSRDEAIAENGRLSDKLSDAQVEVKKLIQKLKDSDDQVAYMKEQLRKYVQEVKKAEEILMQKVYSLLKDKEREDLLDHYKSLSHVQVALAGSKQNLEFEATEFRQQICELECEVRTLNDKLHCCQCAREEAEVKLTAARATVRRLEQELENAHDDLRIQKVDLDARKELCDKLDVEKAKLNAELNDVQEIRKKLTKECDKLRWELQQSAAVNQVTTETTDEMMERLRNDQQRQEDAEVKAKNEMERLRQLHQTTLKELQVERARCSQQELLANQYEEQARELRQNLTEDRFRQARTREISPRMPSKTL